jgi:hypothetical protein
MHIYINGISVILLQENEFGPILSWIVHDTLIGPSWSEIVSFSKNKFIIIGNSGGKGARLRGVKQLGNII